MGKTGRIAAPGKMGSGGGLSKKRFWMQAGIAAAASGFIAVLFYNSPWGMVWLPAVYCLAGRMLKEAEDRKRKNRLNLEFKDYLNAASRALMAGYSVERAFVEALRDVKRLHGDGCQLFGRLGTMETRLGLKETIEHILNDFAEGCGSEDIESFVEIFCYAKRYGGDFVHIIAATTARICDKTDIMEEIHTVMAQKALEQKIMCAAPLGILLMFRLTSAEFIGRLYKNPLGVSVMTAALLVYAAAFVLGMKMVEIEV